MIDIDRPFVKKSKIYCAVNDIVLHLGCKDMTGLRITESLKLKATKLPSERAIHAVGVVAY